MIEIIEQSEEHASQSDLKDPLCPHCSQRIEKIFMRQIRSLLGKRYIYYCSKCLKVLGISHRKGFWMG